jgi:hypothetical protein
VNDLFGDEIVFDFETFPQLEFVFREIKKELKMHITLDSYKTK